LNKDLSGILGFGAVYHGDLSFDGPVRIDGELVGDLKSNDLVEISVSGRVRGNVDAAQALIAGALEGTLRARERVTLLKSSRVQGTIETPWLDLRLGAQWSGTAGVLREGGLSA